MADEQNAALIGLQRPLELLLGIHVQMIGGLVQQQDVALPVDDEAMFRAICENSKSSGECSFEARMGCGFGACMGCSCETKYGNKRICRDGPVLIKEEIIW